MSDILEVRCASDAVRCLYLAGVARREGHEEAARRLHAKAAEWIDRYLSGNKVFGPVPRTFNNCQLWLAGSLIPGSLSP
jgi:hypothetical protein